MGPPGARKRKLLPSSVTCPPWRADTIGEAPAAASRATGIVSASSSDSAPSIRRKWHRVHPNRRKEFPRADAIELGYRCSNRWMTGILLIFFALSFPHQVLADDNAAPARPVSSPLPPQDSESLPSSSITPALSSKSVSIFSFGLDAPSSAGPKHPLHSTKNRSPPELEIAKVLEDVETDVVCVHGVRQHATASAIVQSVRSQYPHVIKAQMSNTVDAESQACSREAHSNFLQCVQDVCSQGQELEDPHICPIRDCSQKIFNKENKDPNTCWACLLWYEEMRQQGHSQEEWGGKSCFSPGSAIEYAGNPGTLLLSKYSLKNKNAKLLPSFGLQRGFVTAEINPKALSRGSGKNEMPKNLFRVSCLSISPGTASAQIPQYVPSIGSYNDYASERNAQIEMFVRENKKSNLPHLLFGKDEIKFKTSEESTSDPEDEVILSSEKVFKEHGLSVNKYFEQGENWALLGNAEDLDIEFGVHQSSVLVEFKLMPKDDENSEGSAKINLETQSSDIQTNSSIKIKSSKDESKNLLDELESDREVSGIQPVALKSDKVKQSKKNRGQRSSKHQAMHVSPGEEGSFRKNDRFVAFSGGNNAPTGLRSHAVSRIRAAGEILTRGEEELYRRTRFDLESYFVLLGIPSLVAVVAIYFFANKPKAQVSCGSLTACGICRRREKEINLEEYF